MCVSEATGKGVGHVGLDQVDKTTVQDIFNNRAWIVLFKVGTIVGEVRCMFRARLLANVMVGAKTSKLAELPRRGVSNMLPLQSPSRRVPSRTLLYSYIFYVARRESHPA